ncbi:PTS sugar transporter subunit IIC [Enterococcus quebecensis]|nr:PTS transporter subunit EIIC [Enterococcus quebecensis]OJG74679.1 PTS system transporter subunit IIC [Enterococcus quebecensis]
MKKLEELMTKTLLPLSEKINRNIFLSSLSESFVRITFIILGISLIAIVGYWPIPSGWGIWLRETGIMTHVDAVLNASTNAMAIYISYSFAAAYSKNSGYNSQNGGMLGLLSFLIVSPQTLTFTTKQGMTEVVQTFSKNQITGQLDVTPINAFPISALGGRSLLVALFISFLAAYIFVKMSKKGFAIKLPDSIPPMVSESLSPAIISVAVVLVAFTLRIIFSYTAEGNMVDWCNFIISKPLSLLTATPIAFIFILTLASFMWFFGIHPNVVNGAISPLLYTIILENIAAYQHGTPLPYGTLAIVLGNTILGGAGCTLGLLIALLFAKSKRYKAIFKIAVIPSIFNINEPLIFGVPVVLNPIFFIPMVVSPPVLGLTTWLLTSLIKVNLNPLVGLMPWTTPIFLTKPLGSGLAGTFILAICLVLNTLIYLPFVKLADKQALEVEQAEEILKSETELSLQS